MKAKLTLQQLRTEARRRGLSIDVPKHDKEYSIWSDAGEYVIHIHYAASKAVAYAALMAVIRTVPLTPRASPYRTRTEPSDPYR